MQCLMFVTYVNIEDQRRDGGHRYAVFLAHRTEALALRSAEEEDRRQLMTHMHYVCKQGLQWEWYHSCKGMLEGWGAERRRLKLQANSRLGRHVKGQLAHGRQETYGRYDLARPWYWGQRQLQGVAKGLAQLAGQLSVECGRRDRLVQEENQRRVVLGVSFVRASEAAGRRGLLNVPTGGLGLLHAFVRDKRLMLQHATAHANMTTEARRQAARAIWVRATRHILDMEARGRAQVA